MQRNYRSYQGGNRGYHNNPPNHHENHQGHGTKHQNNNHGFQNNNNNQGFHKKAWNTTPNNGGVPSPLDNLPPFDNRPTDEVFLVEPTLSTWCRLHNTSQHSELQSHEFHVAANIFW